MSQENLAQPQQQHQQLQSNNSNISTQHQQQQQTSQLQYQNTNSGNLVSNNSTGATNSNNNVNIINNTNNNISNTNHSSSQNSYQVASNTERGRFIHWFIMSWYIRRRTSVSKLVVIYTKYTAMDLSLIRVRPDFFIQIHLVVLRTVFYFLLSAL